VETDLFKLNLILHRKSKDIIIFSPAFWFRIIFLLLLAVLVAGLIAVAGDDAQDGSLAVPIIIGSVCLIAALYEESWTFDRNKRIIVAKFGLLILHRTKTYSFAEIENFELTSFLRGIRADKSEDKEIDLTSAFSKANTEEAAGKGQRIIHKRWHQDLILNYKSGDRKTIDAVDSRSTKALKAKAGILADFCGIPLVINY
jgi:hypothetical protein